MANFDSLDDAVRAALQGHPDVDPLTEAATRVRAAEIVEQSRDDAPGLRDLQNLATAVAMPATRALFAQTLAASGLSGRAAAAAAREIEALSAVSETGCLRVEFHNRQTGRPDVAFLRLAPCARDHDLTAQLEKIKTRCAVDKWPEILKHLSSLVHFGRSMYAQTAVKHRVLLKRISAAEPVMTTQVDPANTTIYVDSSWPSRVGIFVDLVGEIPEDELAQLESRHSVS